MIKEYYYRVAGFTFGVLLPEVSDINNLLPSFRMFHCHEAGEAEVLFHFMSAPDSFFHNRKTLLIEQSYTELGQMLLYRDEDGYQVEMRTVSGRTHRLHTDLYFTFAKVAIDWGDRHAGDVVSALLRVLFSQAVLPYGGISLHAAVVSSGGKAYLFMGKSGTGKSTHAALWQQCFDGCELLNDDNPTVRITEEGTMVYGTPWSGKTPCYKNRSFPIGGIVRLVQAPANRFEFRREIEAFITVLPGCAVFPYDGRLHAELCGTLVHLTDRVPVGRLECLPDREAARLCASALSAGC